MPEQVVLSLTVIDPDAVRQLKERPAAERNEYALAALQIGLLSLRHAGGQVDADAVKHQGELLIREINNAMERYGAAVEKALQFGSRGLLSALKQSIAEDFSMDNENGVLRRLTAGMSEERKKLVAEVAQQLTAQLGELSFDKKDSAINRLAGTIEESQKTITKQFSLDERGSALARLRDELQAILADHQKEAAAFQAEVRSTLEKFQVRKEESLRSTTHGQAFELVVVEFARRESEAIGDVCAATGMTTGLIKFCKVGDVVIELGPDSCAPGEKIVIEAKEDSSYDMLKARAEIETGQKNRDAGVGVFVFSKKTAPAMPALVRYGDAIFVVWDVEQEASDVVLKAALSLARAMSFKPKAQARSASCESRRASSRYCSGWWVKARSAEAADFAKLDAAILEVEREAGRLDSVDDVA